MKIILAKPRGFCAGVNMAVETLETALRVFGPPVYVYHEIVHNKRVVSEFRSKGATFVDDLEQVPDGANLVFSAHGVAPGLRANAGARGIRVVDATCPLVTKVHSEAVRFAKHGHRILLIGHEGHDEIVGTMGEAPDRITLVQSEEDAATIEVGDPTNVAYLSQTTLSVDEASRIVGLLRERFPGIVAPPSEDICYATQNRQDAVRRLAAEADLFLVLGSQNSSNSKRLAEIAASLGVRAHLIDGWREIRPEWLADVTTVAITAGASAPEKLVQECIAWLVERYGASVEERALREETLHFQLPPELRNLVAAPSQAVAAG
ncbi:MAG: 4-hydroxy-3-methylbut-2-enyl diphosphate reductase [Dehalococcoidia bacterium]